MGAGNIPFFEKKHRPFVHSHRPDGQDHRKRFAIIPRFFDLPRNLVPHQRVEVSLRFAGHGHEIPVPEILARCALFAAGVDFRHIPPHGIEVFEHRTFYG